LRRDDDLSLTKPFPIPQKAPNISVVFPFYAYAMQVRRHIVGNLGLFKKEDGAVETHEEISVKEGVVRDIRATHVE
jgi:hypothetical protein